MSQQLAQRRFAALQQHVGGRWRASTRQIYGFMDWMHRPPPAPRLLDGYCERNLQP